MVLSNGRIRISVPKTDVTVSSGSGRSGQRSDTERSAFSLAVQQAMKFSLSASIRSTTVVKCSVENASTMQASTKRQTNINANRENESSLWKSTVLTFLHNAVSDCTECEMHC